MTTFEGTVTAEEILANAVAMSSNQAIDGCDVELVDVTAVVGDEVFPSLLREVAQNMRGESRISRMAVLVGRELHYGLARMFQAYASDSPTDIHVFRDRDEALAWLGFD
ncbi:MAG: hypothetical protein ACQGVK_26030 [Myxococcota bacterium]